jgi:hypothetical protein
LALAGQGKSSKAYATAGGAKSRHLLRFVTIPVARFAKVSPFD